MEKSIFKEKILGAWLGKAVGGTLGQPYEGCDGPLALTYYDPVPAEMVPNDDLDLQILAAYVLLKQPVPKISRTTFAKMWLDHVQFCWDEYGKALQNLQAGMMPPATGEYDNFFTDGLGAAIRSELWACLAPGDPTLAARYAYEDACIDHAGEGIYAAQFLAAMESQAFTENHLDRLLDAGLAVIPAESRLAQAVRDVRVWCAESSDAAVIRTQILAKWGSENFTDAVMNIPFVIMALLLGKGDFGRTICLAVNCGRDADCTGATAGALMGLMDPKGIPAKWLAPIGRRCVLSPQIIGITPPQTLDELADWVMDIHDRLPPFEEPENPPSAGPRPLSARCGVFRWWFAQDENKFRPELPTTAVRRQFPGWKAGIPRSDVPNDSLYLMQFRFRLARSRNVRVMFNTPENSRVWLDGKYLFGREGGRMAPSLHRCPQNQYADVELTGGTHELLCGIAPLSGAEQLNWVMGFGDPETKLFFPGEELQMEE